MYPSSAGAATTMDAAESISTIVKLIRRSVMVDDPLLALFQRRLAGAIEGIPEGPPSQEVSSGGSVGAEPGHPLQRRDHGREVVAAAPAGDGGRAELLCEARERQGNSESLPLVEHEREVLK